jgi:hypothetical protein
MKKLIIAGLLLTGTLIAGDHQEVFVGSGKTIEDSKQDAYSSVAAQGKSINSFVSIETHQAGTNNYITVFKIKTQ